MICIQVRDALHFAIRARSLCESVYIYCSPFAKWLRRIEYIAPLD